ncbi:hypothetical protein SCALM49S_02289 [Streptomyces californicus]
MPPRSLDTGAGIGGKGATPAAGTVQGPGGQAEATHASASNGSSGVGTALAIIGGLLVVLAAAVFLVNRRWPMAGAIASDLPGPDHRRSGSFARHVSALELLTADGEVRTVLPGTALFDATAGGSG